MRADARRLEDLAAFTHMELESHDVEPWADLLADLYRNGYLRPERAAWALTLYNTYDDLGSAWSVLTRWPTPEAWNQADDRDDAAAYPCTQERRNLRGGRVLHRLQSYADLLGGGPQVGWFERALHGDDPARDFVRLTRHMRQVWGVGRQSAFEWAEFCGKVLGLPVDCGNAQLWESEGPRRSLERLWGLDNPTPALLDKAADATRVYLAGFNLRPAMVDFETLICDFNVGRDGRYYPGRHLAALKQEIADMPDAPRRTMMEAFYRVVPAPWRAIPLGGINPALLPVYRDTGHWPTADAVLYDYDERTVA